MPAPPEESEPAMVSATGIVIMPLAAIQVIRSRSCSVLARRVIASKFLGAILSPNTALPETTAMVPFFVQFKCKLGQSYGVANGHLPGFEEIGDVLRAPIAKPLLRDVRHPALAFWIWPAGKTPRGDDAAKKVTRAVAIGTMAEAVDQIGTAVPLS